jgi:hypothetical protein
MCPSTDEWIKKISLSLSLSYTHTHTYTILYYSAINKNAMSFVDLGLIMLSVISHIEKDNHVSSICIDCRPKKKNDMNVKQGDWEPTCMGMKPLCTINIH